eukprot:6563317-Pyramimonas_sp.AAC.1
MSTLPVHAGHPNPPEGGRLIEPSGCRRKVGSSKSTPRALIAGDLDCVLGVYCATLGGSLVHAEAC